MYIFQDRLFNIELILYYDTVNCEGPVVDPVLITFKLVGLELISSVLILLSPYTHLFKAPGKKADLDYRLDLEVVDEN